MANPSSVVRVATRDVSSAGCRALAGRGVPDDVAGLLMTELIRAEQCGAASHGLQRLPEYLSAIDRGEIDPRARPTVRQRGGSVTTVDAGRSLGILAVTALRDALAEGAEHGLALVTVVRSGHLGRLSAVAEELAERGIVTLGFCNYAGTGQKVAPAGSAAPRLATNPIVFGCPAPEGRPVVVDLSTSVWPEGAVRVAAENGRDIPEGVLIGPDGESVTDPRRLYDTPATAALLPLGGPAAGHKGYALAIMVELLAGALADGGVSREPRPLGSGGNAGLFLAFRPEALGVTRDRLGEHVRALEEFLAAAAPLDPAAPVRLPGRPARPRPVGDGRPTEHLELDALAWEALVALATERTERGKAHG